MFSNLFFITLPNIGKYFSRIYFFWNSLSKKKKTFQQTKGLIIFIANGVLIPDFNIWYGIGMALGRLKATLPGIRKAYVPSFSIESENKNIYGTFTFLNYVQFHMMQCSCITQNKCKDDDSSLSLLTVFRKKTVIILV